MKSRPRRMLSPPPAVAAIGLGDLTSGNLSRQKLHCVSLSKTLLPQYGHSRMAMLAPLTPIISDANRRPTAWPSILNTCPGRMLRCDGRAVRKCNHACRPRKSAIARRVSPQYRLAPAVAFPEARDMGHVMTAMPRVLREQKIHGRDAPARMAKGARPVRWPERAKKDHPASVQVFEQG